MSVKKILRPLLTVAAIGAMFIPGGAFVVAGLKIGIGALVGLGAGIGLTLLGPKKPKALNHAGERLQATFDLHAPRKIVFGHTAAATDVRYQAYTGTDQEYCEQILCIASHEVEAIEEIWFDSEKAWSASGGVTSKFSSYLTIATRNPGTSANGIAIDSVWTSACTLTGCAYIHLKFKLTGASKKAESPFAQAIPSRVTVRVKGAKVPDIRVPGVDPDDQTTWVYSSGGSDSGRIPSWQRAFYLIGWRIEGKLAVGRGIPSSRLDFDLHTLAANICDETVALTAGGSEKRYRSDLVVSEGDDPAAVLGNINAAMNAVPTDDGGKIGVIVLHDDLADPDMLELSDADLADPAEESWLPHLDLTESVNVIRGKYTNPSDEALYQMVEAPEIALPGPDLGSPDGIQRIESFDLPAVQSGTQWQRLAHLRLNRTLVPGVYTANFKARAWAARMWAPIRFTHQGLEFEDKLFRVIGMELPSGLGGPVKLTLREESAAIYAAEDDLPVLTPTAPTPWDWQNDPSLRAIEDAGLRASWTLIDQMPLNLSALDGTEPLNNEDQLWGDIGGAGKPADNATVGAAWGVNLTGRPANLSSLTGSESILNSAQLWSEVSGAGKPADNATVGAAWGVNLTGRPANLSSLTGSESILNSAIAISGNAITGIGTGSGTAVVNSAVSISANGTLNNAGGGQVTIGGLGYTGALNATANNVTYSPSAPGSPGNGDIWVDTSVTPNVTRVRVAGAWQVGANLTTNTNQLTDGAGLGTTATWSSVSSRPTNLSTLTGSEPILNTAITISGNAITGIGTGSGTAVANNAITLSSDGTLNNAGGGQVTAPGLGVSPGAGTTLVLVSNLASTYSVVGNKVTRIGAAAWTGAVFSEEALVGACVLTFRLDAVNTMAGLSESKTTVTNDAYKNPRFGIHWTSASGGKWVIYEGGASPVLDMGTAYAGVTFSAATVWMIVYNGLTVRYYALDANGVPVLLKATATTADRAFFVGVPIFGLNASVSQIQFLPGMRGEDNADVTSAITGVAEIVIEADHTGAAQAGQLPRNTAFKLIRNGTDVTTSATWSRTVLSGTVTNTIGAATGVLNTTALGSLEAVTRLTAVYGTTTRTFDVKHRRNDAATPTGGEGGSGSGGTVATKTSFNSISGTSMATIHSDWMTVTVGSAGKVKLTCNLATEGEAASPAGTFDVALIFQRDISGTPTDIDSETPSSPDTQVVFADGFYGINGQGQISFNTTVTGLTAASTQKFRGRARVTNGPKTVYFSGILTADGTVA